MLGQYTNPSLEKYETYIQIPLPYKAKTPLAWQDVMVWLEMISSYKLLIN